MGIAQSDLSREAAESFATPVTLADGFDDQSESGSHLKRFKSEQRLISAARLRFTPPQTVPGSSCDFISDVKHPSHALDIVPGATFTLSGTPQGRIGLEAKTTSYLHPSERGSRTGSTGTFSLAAKSRDARKIKKRTLLSFFSCPRGDNNVGGGATWTPD